MIQVKMVYDPPEASDGERILVDRLWPRGLRKGAAALGEWRRDLAPSDDLRKWFGHRLDRWEEFKTRYRRELTQRGKDPDLRELAERSSHETITLLFAATEREHNNAVAMQRFIEELA